MCELVGNLALLSNELYDRVIVVSKRTDDYGVTNVTEVVALF